MRGQRHAPAVPYPRERPDPVPIVQEAGCASRPVWTGAENLAPTGIRSTLLGTLWNFVVASTVIHPSLMLRYRVFGSKFFVATGLTWFVLLLAEASVCSHYVCSLGYRFAHSGSTDRCCYSYPRGSAWRPGRFYPWRKSPWCLLISVGRRGGLDVVGKCKVFLRLIVDISSNILP